MSEAAFQSIENEANAAAAHYAIEQQLFPASKNAGLNESAWELWIDNQHTCQLAHEAPRNFDFTVEWGKLIFAWWDEQRSQNWRVTSYALSAGEIRLQGARGWGHALVTLSLRQPARWQAAQALAALPLTAKRQTYAETLPQWLTQHFPTARILRVVNSQRRQSLAAIGYTKITFRFGKERALAIGVSAAETQETINAIVAAGLVWLNGFNTTRAIAQRARRLIFCVPHKHADIILERLTFLSATRDQARLECLLVNEQLGELTPVTLATQTELLTTRDHLLHWPDAEQLTEPQRRWAERITQLTPDIIEMRQPSAPRDSLRWLWHGLEFARVNAAGRAECGIAGVANFERQPLTEQNFTTCQALVRELAAQRHAQAVNRRHPLYRLRAEAWLESLLRRDLAALDATLDARFAYSQIPAWQAESRSVLDLLTVTHTGRLAIIEIKEREDGQLPLQGLDYWWRIEQARLRGELTARGLFPGIRLTDQTPLLYLVAPRLRFHRSFATVAQRLSPEIETYRIGLNSNWRDGIRVLTRERINL